MPTVSEDIIVIGSRFDF